MDFKKFLKENIDNKNSEQDKEKLKRQKEKQDIENKIFEFKIKKLNNILQEKGINFSFNIRKIEDHYEFDLPLEVLIGIKTRTFCADLWKNVMKQADIQMDFNDEINRVIKSMNGIIVTMKLNSTMTKELENGEVKNIKASN